MFSLEKSKARQLPGLANELILVKDHRRTNVLSRRTIRRAVEHMDRGRLSPLSIKLGSSGGMAAGAINPISSAVLHRHLMEILVCGTCLCRSTEILP
jgi:hypothetical protein